MKVNKKFVAYPVAFAVAMALGTAHAQTTTNATLAAEGQPLGTSLGSGDIYSKQGHAMRAAGNTAVSSQRLPVMTVTLKDDYQLDDEILLTIAGTNVTPNVDRNATTTALDFSGAIVCTVPGGGNFRISHPDQFIEPVGSAVTSTIRLRVTQRDAAIASTTNSTCVIEGIYVTDASIAAATVAASATATQATITADWDAYDGTYVIGRPEGNDPATSNVKIDDLAAPVVIAVVRNQFEPWAVTKAWDAVIDVQVAGSQYTRLMRLSPPLAGGQSFNDTYSMTDVLQFTTRDRGTGGIGVAGTAAGNIYAGGQTNYFDGAVVSNATFNVTIAGDFNFVRDNNQASGPTITGGDAASLPADCATAATVSGGNSNVAASAATRLTTTGTASTGTRVTSSVAGCSSLSYVYTRPAAAAGAGEAGDLLYHTLTATRGNNTSPWWVRQNFALTSASYNYTGFASVGSRGADPLNGTAEDTDTNLDTSAVTKAGTTTAASYDAGSQDPGNWTINGTRVFVPYMPFDTGITRILRVSNIMFTDGDSNAPNVSITDPADAGAFPTTRQGVNVSGTDSRTGRTTWAAGTPTEDGAVVLYQVWNDGLAGTAAPATCTFAGTTKAKANATTSLAADFRDGVVGCSGILDANGKGTVAAMITIGAPEQGIEVVSAYNVNGDRVQVINNSNGRNNSDTNAEMGSRRPSGRSDYNSPEDLDDNFTAPN